MAVLAAPGASPTTTAKVFFDTVPGDLPPRAWMASSASSRVKPGTVPVTTTDFPARVWGTPVAPAAVGDAEVPSPAVLPGPPGAAPARCR